MLWKALPFIKQGKEDALEAKFKVQCFPTLVLLDEHGKL
jgi:thioredoxin-related protein